MNTQLAAIAAKLTAHRLAAAASSEGLTQTTKDIYKGIFQDEFYKSIWDERVLLALQEFIDRDPPNREIFGAQLAFIKDRTAQVVAINDLLAAFLFLTREELTTSITCLADPAVAEALAHSQASGRLDDIRSSSSQPREKLGAFVGELRKANPSLSGVLTACFDAVCARQELGTVNCADSGARRPRFRDDPGHHSEMKSVTIPG